jgi:hypothetical protein
MLGFRKGWRSFKEGLDQQHIREYLGAMWGHAWEIWWGAGVVGLICTALTLYYAPSRWILGWVVALAFLVAGYYTWRPYHIHSIPKFGVAKIPHLQETPVEQGKERRIFVQIEPKCLTDSPVTECRGHLLRVYNRWDKEEWRLTDMSERLLLEWSHYGIVPITLYPSGGQYLNICWRPNNLRVIVPCCSPAPSRWREVFDSVGTFKFDIEITSKECLPVQVSVTVNIDETEWNKPKVTVSNTWSL